MLNKKYIFTTSIIPSLVWIALFLLEDRTIFKIYLIDTAYYLLLMLFGIIHYLNYLKYKKLVKKSINKKLARTYSIYHEYNLTFFLKFTVDKTKAFTPIVLSLIILTGYYSYKLDYQYNQNKEKVNYIVHKSNSSNNSLKEEVQQPRLELGGKMNEFVGQLTQDQQVDNKNSILFIAIFALCLFSLWVYIQFYKNKKLTRNKIILTLLFSSLLSISTTMTFSMLDFNIQSFSLLKNNNFTLYDDTTNYQLDGERNEQKYLFFQELQPMFIYFDKGYILLDKKATFKKINDYLSNVLNKDNKYYIKVTGSASNETVSQKNALSNNYQISLARANNIKKYIFDFSDKNNINRDNITVDVFAYSNQGIKKNKMMEHHLNRNVKIEIIELAKNITNTRSK